MASSGSGRGKLLTAGGVLSILAGIFQINNGVVLMAYFLTIGMRPYWAVIPFLPGLWFDYRRIGIPAMVGWRPSILFFIMGLAICVFGLLAVIGGISAVRRKRFGLSLAGAICTLASVIFGLYLAAGVPLALGSLILGILAVVFVAIGKREFRARVKEDGI